MNFLLTLVSSSCVNFWYEHVKDDLGCPKRNVKKTIFQNVNHKIIQVVANLLKQLLMILNHHQPSTKDSICVAVIYLHNFLPKLHLKYLNCVNSDFFQKSSFCHSLFALVFEYSIKFCEIGFIETFVTLHKIVS